jgi:hypothetical protein
VENNAKQLQTATLDYLAEKKHSGCMLLLQSDDWTKFAYENAQQAKTIMSELQAKFQPLSELQAKSQSFGRLEANLDASSGASTDASENEEEEEENEHND